MGDGWKCVVSRRPDESLQPRARHRCHGRAGGGSVPDAL